MESCDNQQLVRYDIQMNIKSPLLVRSASIKSIASLEMNKFSRTKNWIHFKNSAGVTFSCLLYVEKFPNVESFLNVDGQEITLPRKGLKSAIETAEVFSSENVATNMQIEVHIRPDRIKIRGEGISGWYSEFREIVYDGPPISFMISPGLFLDIIKSQRPVLGTPRCGSCGLYTTCLSPKMPPTGKNRKKILVIAEAPGEQEDRKNTQLIGESGQFLRKRLKRLGISLDRDCLKTNAVCCRPPDNKTPSKDMLEACFPSAWKTIQDTKPRAIILLGSCATEIVIKKLWRPEFGGIGRWAGWTIPSTIPNAWICPTYHPAYLIRRNSKVLTRVFDSHLEAAIEKSASRPWGVVPDYKKQVRVELSTSKAASFVLERILKTSIAAFDYETNMLKPDDSRAQIVSCSICFDGKETIAFPWQGDAAEAARRFLRSRVKKIAANMKFEDRWTRKVLGFPVARPFWDTMQAAHMLDNRPGICGLKFQSYVLLGAPDYDSNIEAYLKSGPTGVNRVREIDIKELLMYNALDSLFTYKIAMMQMEEFKPFPLPRIGA
jgi:DNA polymerase